MTKDANKKAKAPINAKNEVSKILRLSEDNFVAIDDTGHKLRLMVVKYEPNGFQLYETLIYQDFNATIKNVLGELGKLYIIVDDRLEIKVKVLTFSESMTNMSI